MPDAIKYNAYYLHQHPEGRFDCDNQGNLKPVLDTDYGRRALRWIDRPQKKVVDAAFQTLKYLSDALDQREKYVVISGGNILDALRNGKVEGSLTLGEGKECYPDYYVARILASELLESRKFNDSHKIVELANAVIKREDEFPGFGQLGTTHRRILADPESYEVIRDEGYQEHGTNYHVCPEKGCTRTYLLRS